MFAKYAALTPKVPEGEEPPLPRTATDAPLELDYVFGFGAPGQSRKRRLHVLMMTSPSTLLN